MDDTINNGMRCVVSDDWLTRVETHGKVYIR